MNVDGYTPPDLHGTTVLVTGATQGMGRALAQALAGAGASLLLHGRRHVRMEEVAEELRERHPGVAVRTYLADLADLEQVRGLADFVQAAEPRLHVLVNNAAVGGGSDTSRREVSRQGHELRFAVNHLAPHVLTRALLPLLSVSAPARVVNVASLGQAPIDFHDVMLERGYEGMRAYCQSKLALIMDTFELAAELADTGVTVNALHPATLMDTRMVREIGYPPEATLEDGVGPTLRLVADPELAGVTGRYFDRFDVGRADEQAYDASARARLSELTERLTARYLA
ncbi:SDR family NAD(P)-dependent oxidoreductase [Streptomyces sp. LX-29]|uniref:SDR family NAD(P)-dependent oxidoreductase n=1 Tax=Streptomyces sp. LX-29 TaxID=2900152 RepID=UPI00240DAAF9|nr:SDR family NAD(P)-dependent oxidoreductase [Streptomyces sp. LX-29]WFB07847.1 SDR family NAD(P)-dependent oxidoreductase [Streptomyces sp. LX-29]